MSDLPVCFGCSIRPGVGADANKSLSSSNAPPLSCSGTDAERAQGCASAASAGTELTENPGASTSDMTSGAAKGLHGAAMQPLSVDHAAPGLAHGSDSPRLVIRGEYSEDRSQCAHVDWLSFTLVPPPGTDLPWLFKQLDEHFQISHFLETRAGWYGYDKRYDMNGFGLVGCGGLSQRGTVHVSVNANGCARVPDWDRLKRWGEELGAIIKRVDLAHDDFEGKAVNIETALSWYRAGGFGSGGCSPSICRHGDWDNLQGGRTIYIGKRTNGNFLRVYEKGKKHGDPQSPWVRVELELRGKNRHVPWDVLTKPGDYLSGSFPCLRFLSAHQDKAKTIRKITEISLERSIEHARSSCGPLINLLMQMHDGDAVVVVDLLRRDGVPRRLAPYVDFLLANSAKGKRR
ncbi:replication initiation factor domain-containing protein [Sulfuricaulis sp.]|jgi:phage replication initiation protein|uniref:replication initiation factor domain-containing protein n=1 Tax=Sulfuricaulis sp. TaxID=2003553 RepID=UPI003559783B